MRDTGVDRRVGAVVFDIGGVLLQWDPEQVYRDLIPDPTERTWFLTNVCTPKWNAELDAGRSMDEACEELATRYPAHAALVHAWKRQDEMIVAETPGIAEIVQTLRQAGLPIYILTNMPADVFARRRERYEILRQFDGAVVSGEEGILKPSAEIFRRLADRFALDPSRTLFIDDAALNIAGARSAGFLGHRFRTCTRLALALGSYGIRL